MRIRYKLILAIGVPLLILLTLMVVSDYFALRTRAEEETSKRLSEAAFRYAAVFDGRFRELGAVARLTAAVIEADGDPASIDLYRLLAANVESDPLIFGACVAFVPGAIDGAKFEPTFAKPETLKPAAGEPRREASNLFAPYVFRGEPGSKPGLYWMDIAKRYDYTLPEHAWFADPAKTGKGGWGEPYVDDGAGGVAMVTCSYPITINGKLIGVATVDVELESLRMSALAQMPAEMDVWIISRAGVALLTPTNRFSPSETLEAMSKELGRADFDALVKRIREGAPGTSTLYYPPADQRFLVFNAKIPASGWTLVGSLPENLVMAPVHSLLMQRAAVGLVTIAVILGVVLGMGIWIVSPIRRLADAVRGLSVGMLERDNNPLQEVTNNSRHDEVGDLSRAFQSMLGELHTQVAQLKNETRAREAVESELRLARAIQVSLLPTQFVDRADVRLHAISVPAKFVGGDFFDYLFLPSGELAFVIADVSGKGVPAAMFMAVTRTILRDLLSRGEEPGEVLTKANALLMDANPESMFVTVFLGRYDPATGKLLYANAGHPPPLAVSRGGVVRELAGGGGTVLGVLEGQAFTNAAGRLEAGERLVAYTDGVSEAKSPAGPMFMTERLEELCRSLGERTPEAVCKQIFDTVDEFQAGRLHDDVTVLVLERAAGVA